MKASPPPTKTRRCQIADDLLTFDVMLADGFAFRTDDALERAYQVWIASGRPKGATLRIDNEPNGAEKVVLTVREDGRPQTCADCYPHPQHRDGRCGYCPCGHSTHPLPTPPVPEAYRQKPESPVEETTTPPVLRW